MDRTIRYGIEVTTFNFSIGGEHYYGKAWATQDENGKYSNTELTRVMDEDIARKLSVKDRDYHATYEAGDTTERFDREQEVIDAGVQYLVERFGENIVVEVGLPQYRNRRIVYPVVHYVLTEDEISLLKSLSTEPLFVSNRDNAYNRYPGELDTLLDCRLVRGYGDIPGGRTFRPNKTGREFLETFHD